MWIALSIIVTICLGVIIFIHTPRFGSTPKGERKEKIRQSPNYRDGEFRNLNPTPQFTSDKSSLSVFKDMLFKKKDERLRPKENIPTVKTDLLNLDRTKDLLVWMGHSSYFMQINGKRILVDPVLSKAASPVWFVNKAFEGTLIYEPDDIPAIDYLIITHDHWDHLDYPTVKALRTRVANVICPLGVGEHFERWKYNVNLITEMDWEDKVTPEPGMNIWCLPSRHFSGRSLKPKQSLWASFMVRTGGKNIFIGGDGGYDTHFKRIGAQFGTVDLAMLENGQYNQNWKYIHMLPEEVLQAGRDLNARMVFPVHNSKYALADHPWDEPLRKVYELHTGEFILWTPMIGQEIDLNNPGLFAPWWENVR